MLKWLSRMSALSALCLGLGTNALAQITFTEDYQGGLSGSKWHQDGGCYDYSVGIVNDPCQNARGNRVLRMINRMGQDNRSCDGWEGKRHAYGWKHRVEQNPKQDAAMAHYGRSFWVGERIFVPPSWPKRLSRPFYTIAQIIPIFQGQDGTDFKLKMVRSGSRTRWEGEVRTSRTGRKTYDLGPVVPGAYFDVVIHYKRSTGRDGIAQVWRGGKLVMHHRGPTTWTRHATGTWKHGIYISGPVENRETYTLYFDDVKIAQGANRFGHVYTASDGCVDPVEPDGPAGTVTTPPEDPKDFDWAGTLAAGAAGVAAVAIGKQVVSPPHSQIETPLEFLGAMDSGCVDFRVSPMACASPFWPDCSIVSWRQPVIAAEVVKIRGDTVLSGAFLTDVLGSAAASVMGMFAEAGMQGGGGAGRPGISGHGNLHFHVVHTWTLPDMLCNSPCGACGNREGMFRPNYLSELDPHWNTGELTSPSLLTGMPSVFGMDFLGVWQRLAPITGHVVHSSDHVASGVAAARGMWLAAFNDFSATPRVIVTPGEPSACIQPAWPTEKSCMLTGMPPVAWDNRIYAPHGKSLWFFWSRRQAQVSLAEAYRQQACVEILKGAVLDSSKADLPPLQATCVP